MKAPTIISVSIDNVMTTLKGFMMSQLSQKTQLDLSLAISCKLLYHLDCFLRYCFYFYSILYSQIDLVLVNVCQEKVQKAKNKGKTKAAPQKRKLSSEQKTTKKVKKSVITNIISVLLLLFVTIMVYFVIGYRLLIYVSIYLSIYVSIRYCARGNHYDLLFMMNMFSNCDIIQDQASLSTSKTQMCTDHIETLKLWLSSFTDKFIIVVKFSTTLSFLIGA